MKWCLVAAGVKDLNRPADKLSVSQNVGKSGFIDDVDSFPSLFHVALMFKGFIWVRYSLVITPINYSLAAVNHPFFLSSLHDLCFQCLGQFLRRRIWINTAGSHCQVCPSEPCQSCHDSCVV